SGVFKSTNAGANWSAATNGMAVRNVTALAATSGTTIFAGTSGPNNFGVPDAFLTKFGPNGYSVVFGGSGTDKCWDVSVDAAGNAFVVGETAARNFPTTNTAGFLSPTNHGYNDVFVSVINP